MRGREVFKHAVKGLVESSQIVMAKAGLKSEQVDWFIPHQANQRIMDVVADSLGFKEHQIATTIQTTGNTSSASIPLALSQYHQQGKIKRGDKVLMAAFGAGITHGAALIEF
jgi:3-oxoacyl-[acyl-carrier-protein] synthase-3